MSTSPKAAKSIRHLADCGIESDVAEVAVRRAQGARQGEDGEVPGGGSGGAFYAHISPMQTKMDPEQTYFYFGLWGPC